MKQFIYKHNKEKKEEEKCACISACDEMVNWHMDQTLTKNMIQKTF